MENSPPKKAKRRGKIYYRCAICGFMYEAADENDRPKNCVKCDGDKFYKIVK